MITVGSGESGELTFLDFITLISFYVGVLNLKENLTQGDKQELQKDLTEKTDIMLKEIHTHLESQDNKLDRLLQLIGGDSHDSR